MAGVSDLFGAKGKNVAEQLVVWGVLNQLISTAMGPIFTGLAREINDKLPLTPLSPADLADMVVRHILALPAARDYAAQSGIAGADFERLVQSAGEGPAPGELAEALRRGIIPESGAGPDSTSFEQGLAESHLRDKWAETVKKLAVNEPSPGDALDALLEGQIPEEQAKELYQRFGGDLEHFQWLFNSRGSAPTPVEASEMANRGIIPWDGEGPDVVSYHQAFLEGPWRDKWEQPYRGLAQYRPPLRTITAMVRNGSISDDVALQWFRDLGASDDMAQAQLRDAHSQKTQAQKELAVSTVLDLYRVRFIDTATASGMLEALRYSAADAAFLLELEDFKVIQSALTQAIAKLKALYVARKIDAGTVKNDLNALLIPPAHSDELLQTWDLERQANVKTLTAAEIATAMHWQIITQDEAQAELENMGYTPRDAWIYLSQHEHQALPNPPAA